MSCQTCLQAVPIAEQAELADLVQRARTMPAAAVPLQTDEYIRYLRLLFNVVCPHCDTIMTCKQCLYETDEPWSGCATCEHDTNRMDPL